MKIGLVDIETFPLRAFSWGPKWEANLLKITEPIQLAMFAYKTLGEKEVYAIGLPDVKNEKALVKELWRVFDQYDVLIAHNGARFDFTMGNAFFAQQGLKPPSPYQVIDTKLVAKRYFRFTSNKLDDLGTFLELGRKEQTGGMELWWDCMDNKPAAWAKMRRYNKQDVLLLEKVYLKLRPWMVNHPNSNVSDGTTMNCPTCAGANLIRRGFNFSKTAKRQRYVCMSCRSWSNGPTIKTDVILR